jgi:chromosome segregation ATPase
MATLTTEEIRAFVEKLIASGNGDVGRLNHIYSMLKGGRPPYASDKKYLDSKLAQEIGLVQKVQVDENITSQIQRLIDSGNGDVGRLQFILESLKQGKSLYKSDQQYLDAKLGRKVDYQSLVKKPDPAKTIESLKSQIQSANEKIIHLESVLHLKVQQLDNLQAAEAPKPVIRRGAMPKGWKQDPVEEIATIQQQIKMEQTKLDKEKTEAERLKIEQSKLMQIILDRQEFEKQVKIEQERLQQQIERERQTVLEQSKLVEQIKAKEAELEKAKKSMTS